LQILLNGSLTPLCVHPSVLDLILQSFFHTKQSRFDILIWHKFC
jgi:hypothetical protein